MRRATPRLKIYRGKRDELATLTPEQRREILDRVRYIGYEESMARLIVSPFLLLDHYGVEPARRRR